MQRLSRGAYDAKERERGDRRWLTRSLLGHCPIFGLPEGEGFPLDGGDETRRVRSLPWALVAALPQVGADPPALSRQAVALADDQHGELGLAARRRLPVDFSKHRAQSAHLRPGESVAEMLEQLAVGKRDAGPCGGDQVRADFFAVGQRLGHHSESVSSRRPSVPPPAPAARRRRKRPFPSFFVPAKT